MAERQKTVAIVGGGLAGMTLALALAKENSFRPIIYELREQGDNRGANIALAPNGLRVLQHVGVYDKIRPLGYSFEAFTTYNGQGQVLGRALYGSEQHYGFRGLRIHRAQVHQALLDEVKAQGIPIRNGMRFAAIYEETDNGVKFRFENGQIAEADFLIGADGIHSKVRPYINKVEPVYSGFAGIIGLSIKRENLHESHRDIVFPCFTFGKTGFVAMMPSNHDGSVIDFFSTFPFPSQTKEWWEDFMSHREKQKKMLVERFGGPEWPLFISKIAKEQATENLNAHPFFEVPELESWHSPKGRVILLGDSAHAMSPQAGIGASLAFEDAESLMCTMTHKLFANRPLDLLTIWENHRRDRVKKVLNAAHENGRKRRPESSIIKQKIKELTIWAQAMWNGPMGGQEWMYGYKVEEQLHLPSS
ncbi:hypothetical protein F5884DRAFT_853898 [Xylogone sp. PMI_703]|nr:hypothetical protein F5884DRAFT_853898 [Xylogone sp. PMI_703]